MKHRTRIIVLVGLLLAMALSACGTGEAHEDGAITASGTISADMVQVAAEMGGTVLEVLVEEGQVVEAGDVLLRMDEALINAQYVQAEAAIAVAERGLEAALAQMESAEAQLALAVQGARLQESQLRQSEWLLPIPSAFDLPNWYFDKDEQLDAVEGEIEAAEHALGIAMEDLEEVLADASSDDFLEAEERLAAARIAYRVAEATLDQARSARDRDALEDVAREAFEAAEAELEAAQQDYDRMLSTAAADEVTEARAAAAVARARLDYALDERSQLQTGEESLQVQAAAAAVGAAESAVGQAEAGVAQAHAALELLAVQQDKMTLHSPISGTVMASSVAEGELASPGATLFTIADLEAVRLTVYIPENQYGRIQLGQDVDVSVDSFPGDVFEGEVVRIADEAEFTPRNVQTVEGRQTTVYAVFIELENEDQMLKPGMPADVVFLEN